MISSQHTPGNSSSDTGSVDLPSNIGSLESEENIFIRNSRKRCFLRSIFLAIIVIIGITCTTFLSILAFETNREYLDENFDFASAEFSENFGRIFENKISIAQSLSQALSSDAHYYNKSWPNVTMPNFSARVAAGNKNSTLNFETVIYAPLVTENDRDGWEAFAVQNEGMLDIKPNGTPGERNIFDLNRTVNDGIYGYDNGQWLPVSGQSGPYFVAWQIASSDSFVSSFVLEDLYSFPTLWDAYKRLIDSKYSQVGEYRIDDIPTSVYIHPIKDENDYLVGVIQIDCNWNNHLRRSIQMSSALRNIPLDMTIVVETTHSKHSFHIAKTATEFNIYNANNEGDGTMKGYFESGCTDSQNMFEDECHYKLKVLDHNASPTSFLNPTSFTVTMASIFALNIIIFSIYIFFVERTINHKSSGKFKSLKCLSSACIGSCCGTGKHYDTNAKHERRLSSSFKRRVGSESGDSIILEPAKTRLRTFLRESEQTMPDDYDLEPYKYDAPIADLFPETTVMFADIAGFTAWSSEREPSQVFYLLENVYRTFDSLAVELGVFKVETIGDCYVAVTGLPDPSDDHAVNMALFSHECLTKVTNVMKSLEAKLGPGTSDLSIRVGLHSGAVTAGVLRGEKSRFQLFGDTMNTAARMESTGTAGKIHISQETANRLKEANKGHWLTPRSEIVNVKGGDMMTYWMQPSESAAEAFNIHCQVPTLKRMIRRPSNYADNWGQSDVGIYGIDADKKKRLVNWNYEVLGDLLSKLVAWRKMKRPSIRRRRSSNKTLLETSQLLTIESDEDSTEEEGKTVIDEVSEIISLPTYSEQVTPVSTLIPDASRLSDEVKEQLHNYIARIADCYHNVPFHNLEHASHVTLSANKLMMRIISPGEADFDGSSEDPPKLLSRRRPANEQFETVEKNLHISTFGISSDPLCQLAIVFSALIHDVEHTGLPNAQLVRELSPLAAKYKNKSVAEQNSVDISWSILMEEQYKDLRDCIFGSETELRRFRQLVVNSVMATDIVDKELKQLRENRWAKAFDVSKRGSFSADDVNRKATIVIEHIIQASDVAHTMQHWHIYCKWNEKLFCEMYTAYLSGHATVDPSKGWFEGEIWFFDNYVIPLARKLRECGVFGVAGDEYLSYAEENRKEWQRKGKGIVARMLSSYQKRHGGNGKDKIKERSLSLGSGLVKQKPKPRSVSLGLGNGKSVSMSNGIAEEGNPSKGQLV